MKKHYGKDRSTEAVPIHSEDPERQAHEIAEHAGESVPDAIRKSPQSRGEG